MILAVNDKVILKTVPMPDDALVTTPDGNHPFAFEVVSIGGEVDLIVDGGDPIAPGDMIMTNAPQLHGQKINGVDYYAVSKHQVVARLDEEDLAQVDIAEQEETKGNGLGLVDVDGQDI